MLNQPKLYVELIHAVSGLQPSWEPSRKIEVGDFGTVSKNTGEFEKEGTIYDPKFEPEWGISRLYPPEFWGEASDLHIISSRGAKALDSEVMTVAKLLNYWNKGKIVGHWSFTTDRAAIVTMYHPTVTRIKLFAELGRRLKAKAELTGKVIVSSVYTTPMFAMLLTDHNAKGTEAILALNSADAQIGDDGPDNHLHWLTHSSKGVWVTGDDGTFYPLYELRGLRKHHLWDRVMNHSGLSQH